jgi:predicted acylesterase/phospholipase RssA
VIAVNAVPPLRRGVTTVLSRVYQRINRLNPLAYFGGSRGLPNLFDVTMNSIQQLQHELGAFKAISADVRIVPDLSEFTWVEFYRPKELIERGYEAGVRAVPEVRRALAEKLGGAPAA